MAKYFGRQYRIDFTDENGTVLISFDSRDVENPLQIVFSADTSFGAALSLLELSIYGLSKDSIGQINQSKSIIFQAGYSEAFGIIFEGDVSNIATPRESGVERRTTVYCWSGLKQQGEKLCEVSFADGANYSDIIDFIAGDYLGNKPEYIGFDDAFKNSLGVATDGYSGTKPHKVFLNDLAYDHQFEWLIQNKKCLLMRRGASRSGERYLINQYTGLIGGVSLTFLGADFEMKLNPKFQIGDKVKVEAEANTINFSSIYFVSLPEKKKTIGDGEFTIKSLRRYGDYYGNSWNSSFTCWRDGETGLSESGAPLAN